MSIYNKYPRGSEWRKWDLHVHTPKSIEQNYGGDTEEIWEKFISDIESLPKEFKVIGINDYIFLDGYKTVLKYKKSGRLKNIDLILPVIELRIDKFGSIGDEAWKRVNFHIIFSDAIKAEIIEQQFLNAIFHTHKLSPEYENLNFSGVITRDSLIDFGQKIINSSNGKVNGSPLKIGFNNITFGYQKVKDILEQSTYFKDMYLTAVGKTEWDALRWNSSIADKKTIINDANLVFISSNSPQSFYKAKERLKQENVNSNLIDCSDAHTFSDSKDSKGNLINNRIGKCFTWIKADPTFEGLKQIIYEPEDRVKIQEEKPEQKEPYNLIDYVQFIDSNENFTNEKICLNQNLNVIIGGKSTGKSILLREIARTINPDEVKNRLEEAILRDYKIYEDGKTITDDFIVRWIDEREDKRSNVIADDDRKNRKIIYIPQSYLNRLVEKDEEQSPIDRLIENILKNEENIKHLFENLDNQINENNRKISNEINELIQNLHQLDIKLEEMKNLGDKEGIEKYIEEIKNEIESLQKKGGLKDDEINEYKEIKENIEKLKNEINFLSKQKNDYEELLNIKKFENSYKFNQFAEKYENLKNKANSLINKIEDEFNKYLQEEIEQIDNSIKEKNRELDDLNRNIKPLLEKVKNIELLKKHNETLSKEEEKLKQIKKKEAEKEKLLEKRNESVNKLVNYFIKFYEIKSYFATKIEENNSLDDELNLEVKVNPKNEKFNEEFINEVCDIRSLSDDLKDFKLNIEDINNLKSKIRNLINDILDGNIKLKKQYSNDIKEILQKLIKDWSVINYSITYDGDKISNMSQGKKSFVLLRLIIELDKSKCPLLIDQPEDDLDNRSIYNEIVKFLKDKKKERQIIIVTHNANLAVATDAECIIVANQDGEKTKNKKFKFEYVQGSLENTFIKKEINEILYKQGIKEHVCEILEGGEEAFESRKNKYNFK